jgi:hypothetical protein
MTLLDIIVSLISGCRSSTSPERIFPNDFPDFLDRTFPIPDSTIARIYLSHTAGRYRCDGILIAVGTTPAQRCHVVAVSDGI